MVQLLWAGKQIALSHLPILQKCNITLTIISQNHLESSGLKQGLITLKPLYTNLYIIAVSVDRATSSISENSLPKSPGKP